MAIGDSLVTADALSNRPPATDFATVDVRGEFVVLDFDDSTEQQAQFQAIVPSHYGDGEIEAVLTWTSTSATSGNCKFQVELLHFSAGDNLDAPPAASGSSEATVAAPSADGDLAVVILDSIAVAGLTSGDILQVIVTRQAADAADTLVGDVELVSLELREA